MDINTYLAKLNYQPIDTLPWDEWEACDGDTMRDMPIGIVLLIKRLNSNHNEYILIGDGMGGIYPPTTNHDDYGSGLTWYDAVRGLYTHWAWIWDVKE